MKSASAKLLPDLHTMSAPSGEDMGEELTLDAAAQVERALIHLFIKCINGSEVLYLLPLARAAHCIPVQLI